MIQLLDLGLQMAPLREELHDALDKLLEGSDFVSGKAVSKFEDEFAKYIGARQAIACANGTEALTLALRALGTIPGDRILTVSHTFIATASAILHAGATPDFVDVDLTTELMSPAILNEHLSISDKKGIRYRGLIVVHLRGNPCPIDAILSIAKERKMFIIEDAAQAHGALYNGRKVGTFGDAATFSFFPGKNLGALGDAGAVVTNSKEVAESVSMLRDHGRKEKYLHKVIGYNSRMDTIQAAWLSIKLRHLDAWNKERRRIAGLYLKRLDPVKGLEVIRQIEGAESVYHHFAVRCGNRDGLVDALRREGVQAGIHYPVPVHLQPAFKDILVPIPRLPNTETISRNTVSLPIYPEMTEQQVEFISGIVRSHCATAS